MGVKRRSDGVYDVELRHVYVKRVRDTSDKRAREVAHMLYQSGKRLLALGKPLSQVVRELKGGVGSGPLTLDQYSREWFSVHTGTPHSLRKYQYTYKRISRHLGDSRVADIDMRALRELVKTMADDGYAANTIHQTVGLLKCMLSDAYTEGLVPELPPRRIKNLPPAKPLTPRRAITREEHAAIVENADERWRAMITVWPYIGLRRGELIALERSDIDLEAKTLRVARQLREHQGLASPKYGSERTVELPEVAVAVLAEWLSRTAGPIVFPSSTGRHLHNTTMHEALARIGEKVGFHLHPHMFRHTAGSWMLAAGCPVPYVARQLGHTPHVLMKVYAHDLREADSRARGLFEDWLKG